MGKPHRNPLRRRAPLQLTPAPPAPRHQPTPAEIERYTHRECADRHCICPTRRPARPCCRCDTDGGYIVLDGEDEIPACALHVAAVLVERGLSWRAQRRAAT